MKFFVASDLHLELHRSEKDWLPEFPTDIDLLILAGDIDVGNEAVSSVKAIGKTLPNTQIVYVAGNHEFYYQNIDEQLNTFRNVFGDTGNIKFLENETFDFNGYRILGCTLWTGFDAYSDYSVEESMGHAGAYLPDFKLIRITEGLKEVNFTTHYARNRFQQSIDWLERELRSLNSRKSIVVTHFPPHTQCAHGKIPIDVLSNYFVSNAGHLIEKFQPEFWCYGHNHWNEERNIGSTELVCNQLGYPKEEVGDSYHAQVIRI